MLEQIINEYAEKICRKRGFKTPYNLIVKAELPNDSKDRERIIIIKAGSVPTVFISQMYIMACIASSKEANIPSLRDSIERALEYLPKMMHTLALVPVADAIALRKDSKRWYKANIPNLIKQYDDRYLEYSFSVTVSDRITGTSVTRNGMNVEDIKQKAKTDLIKLIQENEEMDEMREIVEEVNRVKKLEVKPNEVSLTIGNGEIETRMEY